MSHTGLPVTPLSFARMFSPGLTHTEGEWEKSLPRFSPALATRYLTESSDNKKKFNSSQFAMDISKSLNIDLQTQKAIHSDTVFKIGQIAVNRMTQKKLDLYVLLSNDIKAITSLIENASESGHPGGVIVPAIGGWMTCESFNSLRRSGFDIFTFAGILCIQNHCFAVEDMRDIQRILESDDSLCVDDAWTPRKVSILGEEFLIELPPYWYNGWKNAFETDAYGEGDLEYYELQKEMVIYRLVNESDTLEFRVNIKHPPSFLLNNWKIVEQVDQGSGAKRQLLYFNETQYVDTSVMPRIATSPESRARIQQQRINRIDSSHELTKILASEPTSETAQLTPPKHIVSLDNNTSRLCQIVEDGRSVRYGKKTYRFTGRKRWDIVRALIEADGEYIPFKKAIGPAFQHNLESEAFYKKAIEAEGKFRNGTGHYRIKPRKNQKALR